MMKKIVSDNKLLPEVIVVKTSLVYQPPKLIPLDTDEIKGGPSPAGNEGSNGLLLGS